VWLLVCRQVLSSGGKQSHKGEESLRPPSTGVALRLLRHRAVWAVFILHFSSNWFVYLLLTWLPTYLTDVRRLPGALVAAGSALPFLAALLAANGFALLIAKLSRTRDATRVRKGMLVVYALAAAVFVFLPHLQNPSGLITALVASTALMTAATPVYAAGSLELAPKAAGMLAGMQQAFANLAGVLAPLATGYLARTSWPQVFYVAGAVCLAGAVTYAIFGSAKTIGLQNERRRDVTAG
jgi:predicted MFS family arabinose efflux permease